ncbi:hypothetical protein PRIPAC_81357 [Pristionchus pacificus]|uniref:MOSC domain-containing protein n=1 Tax=Pristionchus pacificus TaxID=54126 RepID=A0A454XJY9_PRIPA|nr:hypothetical protein PRIPAC_81357 [Pristionchus pacificus]|eukprot:PDM79726.1 hypothetical protein PRIPAC_32305 [Pristionchus pacificus]
MPNDDKKVLLACIGGSILTYNAFRLLKAYYDPTKPQWILVGTVKYLRVFPIKSCRGQEALSLDCEERGVSTGDLHDREFLVINGRTGLFLTARAFPRMILMECSATDGVLNVSAPSLRSVAVVLDDIRNHNVVRRGTLHRQSQADGLDCGDEVGALFDDFLGISDTRLIYYQPHLFNGRPCNPQSAWWNNNPVPRRTDTIMYADLAPYLITTEGSLHDLNERLETPVSSLNFRSNIVVDGCAAWDEDRWAEIRIGEEEEGAQLQCFKPCTRCVLTTVDPATGEKHADMQPLKKLREFRLATEGPMKEAFGQSPMFGVNAGLQRPGRIYVGQTVYVKYKPSAF